MTTGTPQLGELGLTSDEVAARVASGQTNRATTRTSRPIADILRANILTRFNAIISVLLVTVLVFGDPRDALFGFVMIINAVIGIVQELRAKRTLDRLTLLAAPRITVVRAGVAAEIPSEDVVLDDVVVLSVGDQIPVDGTVLRSVGMQANESLLTGEADPMSKRPDDAVLSGSFVVSGSAVILATAVGDDAYANRLAAEAKKFSLARSELSAGIDSILRVVTWLLVPTSALLLWSQLDADHSFAEAMVSTVAGVVAMIPQGLVLLVSMAFAVAVIRLGRRNALVQELPAVETLARVDTVCVDKTGTLTTGALQCLRIVALDEQVDIAAPLGALVATESHPNPTLRAIGAAAGDPPPWEVESMVPFSSERKWSSATFRGHGSWVLGAPEILTVDLPNEITEEARSGHRVLLLGTSQEPPTEGRLAGGVEPVGYAVLAEEVRGDAADTVAYFVAQGVEPKVISGDNATTAAAIARLAGVPNAGALVDARTLPPAGSPEFADAVAGHTVFGRVQPEQKRSMVEALNERGRTVAMTGDGVNDVLALKSADIGIAMGSGAPATRAVAQLVLLDDRFASLPHVVAEGRRVVGNMERVASLFLTKTVYATILVVLIGFAGFTFPFLPRHLTLIGGLTIGIPAFFLSFESTDEPVRTGFLRRVFRFALPAGLAAALCAFLVFGFTRSGIIGAGPVEARTAATITMVALGLWIVVELIEPMTRDRWVLIGALIAGFGLVLALPAGREFFELAVPSPATWVMVAITVGVGIGLVHLFLQVADTFIGRFIEREVDAARSTLRSRLRGRR